MRIALLTVVAALAAFSPAFAEPEKTAHEICLEQLDQWMNLDVSDPGQEVIRKDLKAKLEACLETGGLSQVDLANAYNTI